MTGFKQRLVLKWIFVCVVAGFCHGNQDLVNYIATNLVIEYTVLDNLIPVGFKAQIDLTNSGNEVIPKGPWDIYLSHIRDIEPAGLRPNGTQLGDSDLMVYPVNGVLHRIAPGPDFTGIEAGQSLRVTFTAAAFIITRTDVMPNWYVTAPNADPRTITSTTGESLSFVQPFTTPNQWKRHNNDLYDPYTPEYRLSLQKASDLGSAPNPILPTPYNMTLNHGVKVNMGTGDWVVVRGDSALSTEAQLLAAKLGMSVIQDPDNAPQNRYVWLTLGQVTLGSQQVNDKEAYRIAIDGTTHTVKITGNSESGVFYGGQSLLCLYDGSPTHEIPSGEVVDFPRFPYRGQHLDNSRNFHNKADILRILEAMSMYKMNKFHLHVTDDEGWRLEIPGLPELTTVGSTRCHDPTGDLCLMPQLGSGPWAGNPGSGYLTTQDYKEILQYAKDRHIQVIPEFDMPGHAHAPINAMLARYRKYKDTNITAATEFLLTDLEDTSDYVSIQGFIDNAINPCINSSYTFVEHIVTETIKLHQDIQPLTVFNFGGDEVPHGAWVDSPACNDMLLSLNADDSKTLKKNFVQRVGEIAHRHGLDLSGWEDGLMDGNIPFNRTDFENPDVIGYFWDNVWEWGRGQRAYIMANAGYKVILAGATHMYFDHPYEPDPEENGYYWATRIIPTQKTFSFMPDSLYDNMLVDGNGKPIDRDEICQKYGCEELQPGKEANIIGMQGQLWSETVRYSEKLDYMIFPRLMAVAERSWHKAEWEELPEGEGRDEEQARDWEGFANTLGYRELGRLDALGVAYQIPPPGASISEDLELVALPDYPGLSIRYSVNDGATWNDYAPGVTVTPDTTVLLQTRSVSGSRGSRIVNIRSGPGSVSHSSSLYSHSVCELLTLAFLLVLSGFLLLRH